MDYEKIKEIKTREIKTKINSSDFKNKKIMTFGTFDLLHIGHIKIIEHALSIAGGEENLVIGVSSDRWNALKNKKSNQNEKERVSNLKKMYPNSNVILEDHNYPEETWPLLFDKYNIDLIIMGGDHLDNLSYLNEKSTPSGRKMKISFFERTPHISSSILRKIK